MTYPFTPMVTNGTVIGDTCIALKMQDMETHYNRLPTPIMSVKRYTKYVS